MKKYFQAPWRKKEVFLILFSTLTLAFLALLGLKLSGVGDNIKDENSKSFFNFMAFTVQSAIILGPLIYLTSKKYNLNHDTFGINRIPIKTAIKSVLGAFALYFSIMFIITAVVIYTDTHIPGFQPQESILPQFGDDLRSIVLLGLMAVLFAPIVEEIFFRGFLLRAFTNFWGITIGSIASAALFATAHGQWQNILPIFILGLVINRTVLRTKSIVPAIIFHMINNALVLGLEIFLLS